MSATMGFKKNLATLLVGLGLVFSGTKKAEALERAVKKLNDEFAQSKSDIADQTKELEESAKLRISSVSPQTY